MKGLKSWQIYLFIVVVIILLGFVFGWKIAVGFIGLGAAAETKRRIAKTDQDIKKAKKEAGQTEKDYNDMMKKHDEKT